MPDEIKNLNPLEHPQVKEELDKFKVLLTDVETSMSGFFTLNIGSSSGSLPVWDFVLFDDDISVNLGASPYLEIFSILSGFFYFSTSLMGYAVAMRD